MKKALCLVLLGAMGLGLVLSTGCGGGGGGGGILAAVGVGVLLLTISAGAPAAVPFAASQRSAVLAGSRAKTYKATVRAGGKTYEIDTFDVGNGSQTITFDPIKIDAPADGQYKIEIYSASNTATPFFKGYFVNDVANGAEESDQREVTAASTAVALSYEKWAAKNTSTIDTFERQMTATATAALATLTQTIETELITVRDTASADYSPAVDTQATEVSENTPEPAPTEQVNPNPTPIPETFATTADVTTEPVQVQVQGALYNAFKTLDASYRVASVKGSAIGQGNGVVPILGGNKATNLGALLSILRQTLPTNQAIDYPLDDGAVGATPSVKVYYESNKLVEEIYRSGWSYNQTTQRWEMTTKLDKRRTTTGIIVTANTEKLITRIQSNGAMQIVEETFDGDTVSEKFTISTPAGLSINATLAYSPQTGFYREWTNGTYESGLLYSQAVTQGLQGTFSGSSLTFSFENEQTGKEKMTGTLTLGGLSGSFGFSGTGYIGEQVSRTVADQTINWRSGFETKRMTGEDTLANNVSFSGNTLSMSATGSLPSEGMTLEKYSLTFPNISSVGTAQKPAYSFSGGSGEVQMKYTGTAYSEYGYIYRLHVAFENLGFNGSTEKILEEENKLARLAVTKTNTDNTVDKWSYYWKNEMLHLDSSNNRFKGGHEVIETNVNGDVTINGAVTYANGANSLKLTYRSVKKASDGTVSGYAKLVQGTVTRTMFFSRTAQKVLTGRMYEGEKTEDTGTPLGNFELSNNSGYYRQGTQTTGGTAVTLSAL